MINFFEYGSDVVAIETCAAGAGDMRVGTGVTQVAAVDDLTQIPIAGHLDLSLGLAYFLRNLMQDSTTDPDLVELDSEGKDYVRGWRTVASFVYTWEEVDSFAACDVQVQIGRSGGGWFLRTTTDSPDSTDDCDDTSYDTESEATEAAIELAKTTNEANEGECASEYLRRVLRETAGDPCDDGEFCVYFRSAIAADCHLCVRYETVEQASAMVRLSNLQLQERNPGQLLCGYQVRQMVSVDGHMQWVETDES